MKGLSFILFMAVVAHCYCFVCVTVFGAHAALQRNVPNSKVSSSALYPMCSP